MRVGFVTCVQLGGDVLEEILRIGGSVNAIITLKDELGKAKSGRLYLDYLATQHHASLHKTANINDTATIGWLKEQDLDWLMIIGWSQIADERVLAVARQGTLGMHPTLLPEGRGRASIPWAILKNLDQTGVTLFKLDDGVDTGPIGAQVEIPIQHAETASSLYLKIAQGHRTLIRQNWASIVAGTIGFSPQDENRATFWAARRPEDGRLSPTMTLGEADRLVRAVTVPYPGARWTDEAGVEWVVWSGHAGATGRPGLSIPLRDGTYVADVFERCPPSP
jgi:methionyl-tRNA formyltransferase